MKTTLTYEFNEDDFTDKLNRLVHVDDTYMVLNDFTEFLRTEYKYQKNYNKELLDYIDKLREKIFDIMDEYNISLDRDFS